MDRNETSKHRIYTVEQLRAHVAQQSTEPQIVAGLLSAGSLYLLAGDPKAGKSAILTDLAVHVAVGRDWLERKVRRSVVLWLAYEESERERGWAYGNYPEAENIVTVFYPPKIDTPDGISAIEALVVKHGAKLVVVDPLAAATESVNFDNVGEARSKLQPLKDLAARRDLAVVVVHHLSKFNAQGGSRRMSVAGSHQLLATASGDIVMRSSRSGAGRAIELDVTARMIGTLSIGVFSEAVAKYRLARPEERKVGRKREGADAAILGALTVANGEVTQDWLITETKYKRSSVSKSLSKLVKDRRVEERIEGREKRYALAKSQGAIVNG